MYCSCAGKLLSTICPTDPYRGVAAVLPTRRALSSPPACSRSRPIAGDMEILEQKPGDASPAVTSDVCFPAFCCSNGAVPVWVPVPVALVPPSTVNNNIRQLEALPPPAQPRTAMNKKQKRLLEPLTTPFGRRGLRVAKQGQQAPL